MVFGNLYTGMYLRDSRLKHVEAIKHIQHFVLSNTNAYISKPILPLLHFAIGALRFKIKLASTDSGMSSLQSVYPLHGLGFLNKMSI
jgi:hypothetical protein